MKIITTLLGVFSLALVTSGVVFAMPDTERATINNPRSDVEVTIPAHAVQVAENVFSLGSRIDPQTGKKVDGFMILHPKENAKKPGGTPGGGGASACYTFLATGAKWKTAEPWVVDPTNPEGLSESEIFSILDTAITKWESAAGNANILGLGSVSSGFATDGSMDGLNGVVFGSLEAGTIGVTTVWGIFGGSPRNRELVEWDQIYNTYYSWNTNGSLSDMDFESIATHELGHSFGLGDLYTPECSEETMFGYGSEGETKARTLNAGDITGIQKLY